MVGVVLLLALTGAAQPQSEAYGRALDAYTSGGIEAAAPLLAKVPQKDMETSAHALAESVTPDASIAERTRVEAAALLHTEYALAHDLGERGWGFHIDMAHLLLSFDRWSWLNRAGVSSRSKERGPIDPALLLRNAQHAREFLPNWYAVASGALLQRGMTQPAGALIDAEGVVRLLDVDELADGPFGARGRPGPLIGSHGYEAAAEPAAGQAVAVEDPIEGAAHAASLEAVRRRGWRDSDGAARPR